MAVVEEEAGPGGMDLPEESFEIISRVGEFN